MLAAPKRAPSRSPPPQSPLPHRRNHVPLANGPNAALLPSTVDHSTPIRAAFERRFSPIHFGPAVAALKILVFVPDALGRAAGLKMLCKMLSSTFQVVIEDFPAHAVESRKGMDMATDEGFQTLAVSELQV